MITYMLHAHRDPLTGLGNRRAIQRTIHDLVEDPKDTAFVMSTLDEQLVNLSKAPTVIRTEY